jgi:hypothetical protein
MENEYKPRLDTARDTGIPNGRSLRDSVTPTTWNGILRTAADIARGPVHEEITAAYSPGNLFSTAIKEGLPPDEVVGRCRFVPEVSSNPPFVTHVIVDSFGEGLGHREGIEAKSVVAQVTVSVSSPEVDEAGYASQDDVEAVFRLLEDRTITCDVDLRRPDEQTAEPHPQLEQEMRDWGIPVDLSEVIQQVSGKKVVSSQPTSVNEDQGLMLFNKIRQIKFESL